MNRFRFAIAGLAMLTAASAARATTVVMVSDENLVTRAQAVARVLVLDQARSKTPAGSPATAYRVRVERVLKGALPAGEITVRVLGGTSPEGITWRLAGAPRFAKGERVLLFLTKHADGTWGPTELALGAFHQVSLEGRRLAVRGLADVTDATGKDLSQDQARDSSAFEAWIADRTAGGSRRADYLVNLPSPVLKSIQPEFTYLHDPVTRWFDFDSGGTVHWRAFEGGEPAAPQQGFGELQVALAVWTNDPDTNIRYVYDGTTSAQNGFTHFDGINEVLWEDPNNEIGSTFECGSGGVLAEGGPWFNDSSHGPIPIHGADIITAKGTGCLFSDGTVLEEVLAHELGHTLGLGHSCGDADSGGRFACSQDPAKNDALMRAFVHNDGRGARLGSDDKAGIVTLYGSGGGGGGGGTKPAAPTGLAFSDLTTTQVKLSWTDNANNETSYRVESKTTGGFSEVAVLNANTTSTVIASLHAGTTYGFRLRARNNAGPSGYSNTVTVTTPSDKPAAPANLTAAPQSSTEVRLTWQDKSANETGFGIEISSPSAAFAPIGSVVAADLTTFVVGGLQPATPYTFRIRALGTGGNSAFATEASATTSGVAGACVPASDALCLLGGRFRVKSQWRNNADSTHGLASAVPNSDQTGLFWFFDAANIELIVKVLDGRAITNHFWTFYGALSNVEYWVTVEDTQLGHSVTYHNPQGGICGIGDTSSLPPTLAGRGNIAELPTTESSDWTRETKTALAPACVPSATALCLLGGRFRAEIAFKSDSGNGNGQAVTLPGDTSGMFWFFDAQNIELVVKALNGTPINGKYWIFYGALSDVEYDLTITDTVTSTQKTYHNAKKNLCGQQDTTAFTP